MLNEYPDVLTVKEVREILFIGKNKVYEMIRIGDLKAAKIGRSFRVRKDELMKILY